MMAVEVVTDHQSKSQQGIHLCGWWLNCVEQGVILLYEDSWQCAAFSLPRVVTNQQLDEELESLD
ncbi:MAG: hypothetical protein U0V70_00260 [Terriglobia bacterium]